MSVSITLETSTHTQLGTLIRETTDSLKPGDHVTVTGTDGLKRRCKILDEPRQITLGGEIQPGQFWCYAVCTLAIVDEP